jgi:protease-4
MQQQRPGLFVRVVVGFWNGLTVVRRAFANLAFLGLIGLVFVGIPALMLIGSCAGAAGGSVVSGSALVLEPTGTLVEQLSGDPIDRLVAEMAGDAEAETLMSDLLWAIHQAKDDSRIKVLYLDLDSFAGGGLTKLQAVRAAIEDFKTSGKPVVASAQLYDMRRYYLASAADEVFVHPMGFVLIEGYSGYQNYFKGAIDKLELDWNIFRVGEYKSAVEPFLRTDMSEPARASLEAWISQLWDAYVDDVAAARELERQAVLDYANNYAARLEAADGDAAQAALDAGLVDQVANPDEVEARLKELVGKTRFGDNFKKTTLANYLLDSPRPTGFGQDAVGVIVAQGEIFDGERPAGEVGGDSTAALVRRARLDDKIKALVLRVDSPGGSAFASEIIRREIELAQQAGKPVVASMGSVAASGGYWISMSADEIWAQPTTITGSIGIFGMVPTFQRTLAKIGITTDGVATVPSLEGLRLDRELTPDAKRMIQQMIEKGYRDFIGRVAASRDQSVEDIDSIARGRVWTGQDALDIGLVDHLGGLDEAVAAAARLADLEEGAYAVRTIQKIPTFYEQLALNFAEAASPITSRAVAALRPTLPGMAVLDRVAAEVEAVSRFNDPMGTYAYCFCGEAP